MYMHIKYRLGARGFVFFCCFDGYTPVKLSIEEEKRIKAHTYHCLLTTEDGQMPDPNDLDE